jgi:hypothetical protein
MWPHALEKVSMCIIRRDAKEERTMRQAEVTEHWRQFYEETRIRAAVRDGNRLYVTGHTRRGCRGEFLG